MDINNIQIGITTVASIAGALITALSVFYGVKTQLAVINTKVSELENEDKILHKRVSTLKEEEKKNKDTLSNEIQQLHKEIADMRIEIIREIHKAIDKR